MADDEKQAPDDYIPIQSKLKTSTPRCGCCNQYRCRFKNQTEHRIQTLDNWTFPAARAQQKYQPQTSKPSPSSITAEGRPREPVYMFIASDDQQVQPDKPTDEETKNVPTGAKAKNKPTEAKTKNKPTEAETKNMSADAERKNKPKTSPPTIREDILISLKEKQRLLQMRLSNLQVKLDKKPLSTVPEAPKEDMDAVPSTSYMQDNISTEQVPSRPVSRRSFREEDMAEDYEEGAESDFDQRQEGYMSEIYEEEEEGAESDFDQRQEGYLSEIYEEEEEDYLTDNEKPEELGCDLSQENYLTKNEERKELDVDLRQEWEMAFKHSTLTKLESTSVREIPSEVEHSATEQDSVSEAAQSDAVSMSEAAQSDAVSVAESVRSDAASVPEAAQSDVVSVAESVRSDAASMVTDLTEFSLSNFQQIVLPDLYKPKNPSRRVQDLYSYIHYYMVRKYRSYIKSYLVDIATINELLKAVDLEEEEAIMGSQASITEIDDEQSDRASEHSELSTHSMFPSRYEEHEEEKNKQKRSGSKHGETLSGLLEKFSRMVEERPDVEQQECKSESGVQPDAADVESKKTAMENDFKNMIEKMEQLQTWMEEKLKSEKIQESDATNISDAESKKGDKVSPEELGKIVEKMEQFQNWMEEKFKSEVKTEPEGSDDSEGDSKKGDKVSPDEFAKVLEKMEQIQNLMEEKLKSEVKPVPEGSDGSEGDPKEIQLKEMIERLEELEDWKKKQETKKASSAPNLDDSLKMKNSKSALSMRTPPMKLSEIFSKSKTSLSSLQTIQTTKTEPKSGACSSATLAKLCPSGCFKIFSRSSKFKLSESTLTVHEKENSTTEQESVEEIPDLDTYEEAVEDLIREDEELANLKLKLANLKKVLTEIKQEAAETGKTLKDLDTVCKGTQFRKRFSDPELHCKSPF